MKRVLALTIACSVLAVLFAHTSAEVSCYPAGHTGEGFPAYTCADGRTYYLDLDGDGRDSDTIGRWIETDPNWVR